MCPSVPDVTEMFVTCSAMTRFVADCHQCLAVGNGSYLSTCLPIQRSGDDFLFRITLNIILFSIKCRMVIHVNSVIAPSIALFRCFMRVIKQL